MRTLQERYNAIQEGKYSKGHFLALARMQQPQLITRFNGYDDAVQILKNKGMIQEANLGHNEISSIQQEGGSWIVTYRKDGIKEKVFKTEKQAKDFEKSLNEAKLTKKSLTDYRYKPTNEMDKYPYEQILRGLRVELEALGVHGTPTAEEYSKALVKVSKNLAKDSIFYTNQLAGVNPKVDLHDKMVDATAKNTVDTFNGMKKAELKEGFKKLIKKVLSEAKGDMFGDKETAARADKYGDYGSDIEYEFFSDPENYNEEDTRQGKSDENYKDELKEYLEDNQIWGYTDRIHKIMTGADAETAQAELAEYLDDEGIYGFDRAINKIYVDYPYKGSSNVDESKMGDIYLLAQEFDRFESFVQAVEKEYDPVDDIVELEHIFNSTRDEDSIDYGDENFSDAELYENKKVKSLSELLK